MLKDRACISVSALLFAFRRTAVFVLLVLLAASLAFSQALATLSGTIKDPSGLVIASGVVTLTNDQTAAEKKTVATGAGAYTFTELAPGDYTIHTEAPG